MKNASILTASAVALALAVPAPAIAKKKQEDLTLATCAQSMGTIAVVDGDTQGWSEYGLGSPRELINSLAVESGCFTPHTAAGGVPGQETEFDFGTVLDAVDPSGADFAVFAPAAATPRPALNGAGPGELSYITYLTVDSAAFRSFYSAVLHWMFESGRVEDGWNIEQTHPMSGVAGGNRQPATVPMWTVTDIDAAVARVHAAGGTVIEEPSVQSYGKSALCADDQGGRFYLGEF